VYHLFVDLSKRGAMERDVVVVMGVRWAWFVVEEGVKADAVPSIDATANSVRNIVALRIGELLCSAAMVKMMLDVDHCILQRERVGRGRR